MKKIDHIGIILDGNGRWAKKHFFPRRIGHIKGAKNIKNVINLFIKNNIPYLTIYAFSTENWKRPKDEVDQIIDLLKNYLKKGEPFFNENDIRVKVIGLRNNLENDILNLINHIEEKTKNNKTLTFNIAFNYGGRSEILYAVNKLLKDGYTEISENDINKNLFTSDSPEPDLIIRTSGESRLSNFLLWQSSYSEIYFSDVLWPDFDEKEFNKILDNYYKRERRFGGL